jgi:endonuclease/exonuclease/phosphatase family metal-dependent hydrolase
VIKPQAFRAIRQRTDQLLGPHVVCGDFNTPKCEDATSVTTWAPSDPQHRADWDAAERSVLENLGLRDVYRERHHAGDPFPVSHRTGTTARRYDHIYASTELRATACTYHEAWLGQLSDHAAVEADLAP